MASADLLRIEEFYSSLFDSAKGDGVGSHSQLIERKIEALKDMATKVRELFLIAVMLMIKSNCCGSLVMRNKMKLCINSNLLFLLLTYHAWCKEHAMLCIRVGVCRLMFHILLQCYTCQ